MSWLQCILYGLIMGISEFIPVSSSAQSRILLQLFGASGSDPLRSLVVHIGAIVAFIIIWRMPLDRFLPNTVPGRGNSRNFRRPVVDAETRFIKAAILPMLGVMLLSLFVSNTTSSLMFVMLLIVNGIMLYLPGRMLQGNKGARAMSSIDAWLIGAAGALSIIPGLSRIGLQISVAQICGADRKHALNWGYALSVPALLLLICIDFVSLLFGGASIAFSTGIFGYLLLAVFSFTGSALATYFTRNFIIHRGLSTYAYYSWGSALFVFILYLL